MVARYPDVAALTLVVLVAALVRLAFAFRSPIFLLRDSGSYFLPAWDLAHGLGFDLSIRRTPLYPWFLSGAIVLFGEELQAIALVQHALGIVTAASVYALGRLTFGRLAGLGAGLLTALDGTLLVSERYVMPEALLVPLLLMTLIMATLAIRRRSSRGFLLTGLLLGLSVLCKPVAQVLVPLFALAALLSTTPWIGRWLAPSQAVARGQAPCLPGMLNWKASACLLAGLAVVLVPWMLRNLAVHGSLTTAGALGQTLVARTAKHDTGFRWHDPRAVEQYADGREAVARQIVQSGIRQRLSDGVIYRRVQERLQLSDAEVNGFMRDLALNVIWAQPAYYLRGTLGMTWELLVGEPERLRTDWKTQNARLSRDEWEERIEHLLGKPSTVHQNEFPRAEAIVGLYQPAALGPLLPLLALLGTILAALRAPLRPALLPGLAALALLGVSAALDGPVPRYRYPADPLIALAAMGGMVGVLQLARLGIMRLTGRARTEAVLAPSSPSAGVPREQKPVSITNPRPQPGRAP